MSGKLKHLAIVSSNYAHLGRFYEALFGLKSSRAYRPDSAVSISDGYVGMNINPRKPGRQAGLDHFGFEVDDVETIFERVREEYPKIEFLKRPSNRPFAGISMHDPEGNVFDLSQQDMENRADVYADETIVKEPATRRIKHIVLRVVDPQGVAKFYRDVFDLTELDSNGDDPNFYLSDGTVTFVIAPWRISNYDGSGIERPALDHIGFEVESLDQLQEDIQRLIGRNVTLAPLPVGAGPEGEARLNLLKKCRYGQFQLSDPDGVFIDVSTANGNP
jgi:predicted enzyme related to lactoylglutathione lyase